MKYLKTYKKELTKAERWDYDYHEPPVLIRQFDVSLVKKISEVADVIHIKKDPTKKADTIFQYIDISSINIDTGEVERIQELTGAEAPSRARKLVQAYDIIISTCRPTRRAIAVVPEDLHGQICSTGFSVIRAKQDVNPLYLHYALRLDSTMEQFRKFATGSSYPAILDSDVEKTLIPIPTLEEQNSIVKRLVVSLRERKQIIAHINNKWDNILKLNLEQIKNKKFDFSDIKENGTDLIFNYEQIADRILHMPPLLVEESEGENDQMVLDFND
ncbi:restriction endonuclease subunit S [Bacteroides fragilis]|uniref:Restriction endonuclease subunit S n=1 Tax=Bacteroides fragilis TaxID=817 RepID=A0AAP8ZXP1_BACFG|nr:restriction endonuclease subunit S [Bacteroides fragilis]MBV4154147.1 restriction endonuclease subunit S [Bacteroides fragilis]MCE8580787.1 restriction endonuclease subunit S [Bacteroides fragilis]MCE8650543.1 restriction endonuclease subunit S [Bacteroides fragilis]MCS2596727.1 restriction endonuclease subunit S [Bacteroides fragilis]MCS3146692.1 restriction endonuclease subunit S [Bacteroides fragilis]